jgi:hypothetical protein
MLWVAGHQREGLSNVWLLLTATNAHVIAQSLEPRPHPYQPASPAFLPFFLCRRDMLDEALLRPGRLEVHVEIGLPDERGRVQILQVGGAVLCLGRVPPGLPGLLHATAR